MRNKTGLLLLMHLILTNSSLAQQSNSLVPKATAAETALSFRDIPILEKAFIDAAPMDRKDGILIGELGIDGGNKAMVLKLAQEIADNNDGKFDSFLIAHKGKLLFESYYLRGRINLPHFQASATKAYTSMALGRTIQLGYLTMADLDKPLINFLKELDQTTLVEGVEKITLHQALTMSSGIHLSEEQREELEKNPALIKGQGHVQAFLENCTPITTASQRFSYKDDPRLVMQVIEAVVPGTAKDFIKKELLDKMGITNYYWRTDVSGLPQSGSSTGMTSRDMVKWGILTTNKGKWNGEQLVPEAFLAKATSRILYTGDDDVYGGGKDVSKQGYGYYWWSADLKHGDKSYFSRSAQGGGGQYIILIEELDLMVVVTAHNNDNRTLQIIAERIVPAFIQNARPTMSGKNDSQGKFPALEDLYFGQKPPGLKSEPLERGILTTEGWELGGEFTPEMKEFYFTTSVGDSPLDPTVTAFRKENRVWKKYDFYSTGDDIMYSKDKYIERTDSGWSEVKSLGAPYDTIPIMRLTASSKGTLVFDEFTRDGNGVLRYSRLINGKREAPKPLSKEINTGKWTAHPFIALDESYIIWDSEREGGYGDSDMYISFRQPDGSWGPAINFGDKINTDGEDGGGYVTPDGKYLSYCPRCKPPYDRMWVDAQVIEDLRPKQ